MTHLIKNLRDHKRVLLYLNKMFFRFRLNPSEKRIFWIKEISLDKRNWVIQNKYLSLKDVLEIVRKENQTANS